VSKIIVKLEAKAPCVKFTSQNGREFSSEDFECGFFAETFLAATMITALLLNRINERKE